jgi:1-acyl-sn-glycerol-3-phosphate acyltransferase
MIFPEGTRSKEGELQPFKDGAFSTAIEAGVPILPLAVHGTKTALRKHDWRLGRSNAVVHVLEPVDTEGLTLDDVPSLREQVRSLIGAELERMRSGT